MTASAEYAWPSAAPGAVNPRGPGGPQQLRLARLPQDATDHDESLIGGYGLRPSAAEVRDFTGLLPGRLLGIARHEADRRSRAVPLPGLP